MNTWFITDIFFVIVGLSQTIQLCFSLITSRLLRSNKIEGTIGTHKDKSQNSWVFKRIKKKSCSVQFNLHKILENKNYSIVTEIRSMVAWSLKVEERDGL